MPGLSPNSVGAPPRVPVVDDHVEVRDPICATIEDARILRQQCPVVSIVATSGGPTVYLGAACEQLREEGNQLVRGGAL